MQESVAALFWKMETLLGTGDDLVVYSQAINERLCLLVEIKSVPCLGTWLKNNAELFSTQILATTIKALENEAIESPCAFVMPIDLSYAIISVSLGDKSRHFRAPIYFRHY